MRRRGFGAAETTRLNAGWPTYQSSINTQLRYSLAALRARCRELEQNNDYATHYFRVVVHNVIGRGIQLQMRAEEGGVVDRAANAALEEEWQAWGRPGVCEVAGRLSWADVQRLALRGLARDGEAFVRLVRGFDNALGFALQVVPPERIDETYNVADAGDGAVIRMGVELDRWMRPRAYYVLPFNPYDELGRRRPSDRERVPADEMRHLFVPMRAEQIRGIPWLHAGMGRLDMLGGYEEAELVAARTAASKMGFYTSEAGDEPPGDGETSQGDLLHDAEPGTFERLPRGVDVTTVDWKHPDGNFGPFVKDMLRGVAAGGGVSYTTLTGDLEAVNYSSIRAGLLEERDAWRVLQAWTIEQLHVPVFQAWLPFALVARGLPATKIGKFRNARWQSRGWEWVDPQKEIAAKREEIALGVSSHSDVAAERGRDFEDILAQRQADEALAASYGVTLASGPAASAAEGGAGKGANDDDADRKPGKDA